MPVRPSIVLRIAVSLAFIGAVGLALARQDEVRTLVASMTAPKPAAAPAADRGRRAASGAVVAVTVMEVEPRSVPVTFSAIGTVQPMASVAIKPRIDSQVVSVQVEEGAQVKAGDMLLTLDDRVLKAQLAQIEAQIAKDDAQIAQAERDVARAEDLLDRKIGTTVQKDTAMTTLKALKAQRAADAAQSLNISTQLGFTDIRAPIAGRIGSILAKPGAIVRAADAAPIMTINQVDPIFVAIAVPQAVLPELKASMAKGSVAVEAAAGNAKSTGVVAFIENGVDAATGTIMVKARMNNAAEALWPGAFVRASLTFGADLQALTVPLVALQTGQTGQYVFVADGAGTARQVAVTVSRSAGDDVVIATGLKPGDRVITSGQLRLVNGTAIQIKSDKPQKPQRPSASSEDAPRRG